MLWSELLQGEVFPSKTHNWNQVGVHLVHHTVCFWSIEIGKKFFLTFNNVFHVYLMRELQKNKKNKNSPWLFLKSTLSVLRCTWTSRINLKIFLGYNINYLSIWPFMCHTWFPTRKASKLTFVCFQLQFFSPCNVLNNWSWKQTNVSFEVFLVGNQGWRIKGQMLR